MVNVARLVGGGKPVVIYMASSKSFRAIKSTAEFDELLSGVAHDVRSRIDRYISVHVPQHASLRLL